jgi:hypothetical protein
VATIEDVRRLALALPEAFEDTNRDGLSFWRVNKKLFVWERPLRKSDHATLAKLGETAPDGVILGARVPDETAKFALVASQPDVYFTIPHFNGYPAVLIKLDAIEVPELDEVVTEAWLDRAPAKLAKAFLGDS